MVGWLLVGLMTAPLAHADMYKWTDKDGNLHFSDAPPVDGRAEVLHPSSPKTNLPPKDTVTSQRQPTISRQQGGSASSKVYQWTDESGKVHYDDRPQRTAGSMLPRLRAIAARQGALQKLMQTNWKSMSIDEQRKAMAERDELSTLWEESSKEATKEEREQVTVEMMQQVFGEVFKIPTPSIKSDDTKLMTAEQKEQAKKALLSQLNNQFEQQCRSGSMPTCRSLAQSKWRDGNFREAQKLFSESCGKGDSESCIKLGTIEAIEGDASVARSILAKHCHVEIKDYYKDPCHRFRLMVRALPVEGSLNLFHVPYPSDPLRLAKGLKGILGEYQQTGSGAQQFSDAFQRLLGIETSVDLDEAQRGLQAAKTAGYEVGETLYRHARGLSRYADSIDWHKNDETILYSKMVLLFRKACQFGSQHACMMGPDRSHL